MFTYYKFKYSTLMLSVLCWILSLSPKDICELYYFLTLGMMINLIDRF